MVAQIKHIELKLK